MPKSEHQMYKTKSEQSTNTSVWGQNLSGQTQRLDGNIGELSSSIGPFKPSLKITWKEVKKLYRQIEECLVGMWDQILNSEWIIIYNEKVEWTNVQKKKRGEISRANLEKLQQIRLFFWQRAKNIFLDNAHEGVITMSDTGSTNFIPKLINNRHGNDPRKWRRKD